MKMRNFVEKHRLHKKTIKHEDKHGEQAPRCRQKRKFLREIKEMLHF